MGQNQDNYYQASGNAFLDIGENHQPNKKIFDMVYK